MNSYAVSETNIPQFLDDVDRLMCNHSGMEPVLRPYHKGYYKSSQMAEVGREVHALHEAMKAERSGEAEYCREVQNCPEAVNQHQQVIKDLEIKSQILLDRIINEDYNTNIRTNAFFRLRMEMIGLLLLFEKESGQGSLALDEKILDMEFVHDTLLDDLVNSQGEVLRAQKRLSDLREKFQLILEEKELDKFVEQVLVTDVLVNKPSKEVDGTVAPGTALGESKMLQATRIKDHPEDSGIDMMEYPIPA